MVQVNSNWVRGMIQDIIQFMYRNIKSSVKFENCLSVEFPS